MTAAAASQEDDEALFIQAFDLLMTAVPAEAVRDWCAQSPRHLRIWREIEAIDGMGRRVLSSDAPADPGRRRLMAGGAALAVAGLGVLTAPGVIRALQSDISTARGEIARRDLPQGGSVTLGPRGDLALDFGGGRRQARLLAGMAALEVGSGPPLSLAAPGCLVDCREGAFEISRDAGSTFVAALAGGLTVTPRGAPAMTLAAGDRLVLEDGMPPRQSQPGAAQLGLWRAGLIFADDDRIDAVVARIARWAPGRVVLAGPGLAAARIGGVFRTDDPDAALRAVIGPHDGRLRRIGPYLAVLSTV